MEKTTTTVNPDGSSTTVYERSQDSVAVKQIANGDIRLEVFKVYFDRKVQTAAQAMAEAMPELEAQISAINGVMVRANAKCVEG